MKQPNERKSSFIVMRVTLKEKTKLLSKAKAEGIKLSAFLRSLIHKVI